MRILILSLLLAAPAHALFRNPAVSRTHVAFVHAGQVWVVPRAGGVATRITDTPGNKFDPRFSPDGQHVAFSSTEVRNATNIYIVPLRGGTPRRITWLPSHQTLCQWTADNRLLFYTNSLSFVRIEMQLFTVSPHGGLPMQLPLQYASDGALDATGTRLAYTPQWPTPLIRNWKRYRGGAAPDISIVDLRTGETTKHTSTPGSETRPMWHGDVLHYLADGKLRTRNRELAQFGEHEITDASIGGDAIVLQAGPDLHLYDLRTGRTSKLSITVPRPEKLQREVDAARFITHRDREMREARGDVWLGARNLTATSGAFEREAALSADGKQVAYWSDATGEYQLYVTGMAGVPPAGGLEARGPTRLTNFASGFRYRPVWSGDGKKLAFIDQRGAVFVCDLASRAVTEVDRDTWAELPELAWSADGTWLAYTKTATNRLGTIWRYDLATGQRRQLTTELFNASTPAFSPDGEHLFFISYRNFSNALTDWLSQRFVHRAMPVIMAVPLSGTAAEDFERRAFRLATTPGSITSLSTTDDGNPRYGLTDLAGAQSLRVYRMREKKEEVVTDEATPPPPMKVTVDLRAEWRQIFDDVLRNYRDFFHAPQVPAPDWAALRREYLPLLERCETRQEVNVVLGEMIGEVSVGHAYIANGGDVDVAPANPTGMLGADFALENGAFRLTRIYEGAPWDDTVRSPLTSVREGEYLLAVDGVPLDTSRDPRAAFVADKAVTITVGPNPRIDASARQVSITPIESENPLRYRTWIERNRRYVEEKSQGRSGYIHIPDFSTNGVNEFARQYYGQTAKEALILDARWSQGGSFGSHFAELLGRRHFNSAAIRESEHAWPVPRWGAHFGLKALVVNHMTPSAAENFALYFRKLALGPIIGTRTWGGLTGLNPVPALIDGGYVNVPNAPFFDETGWLIEGHGLEPDITAEGDAALDEAIRAVTAK